MSFNNLKSANISKSEDMAQFTCPVVTGLLGWYLPTGPQAEGFGLTI